MTRHVVGGIRHHVTALTLMRPVRLLPVTIRLADIVVRAGVSEATVSRVPNGKPSVGVGPARGVGRPHGSVSPRLPENRGRRCSLKYRRPLTPGQGGLMSR